MAEVGEHASAKDRRRERWRGLKYRGAPLGLVEKTAVVVCGIVVNLCYTVAIAISAVAFIDRVHTVSQELLLFGGVFCYGLPITLLGAYWGIRRYRSLADAGVLSCLKRGVLGAAISALAGVTVGGTIVGLIFLIDAMT